MKLHIINGYIQNIHLVEYKHGCLLLDGCCRVDIDVIQDFFKNQLNRPIEDLKVVVVTHMHPDHAGCALALKKLSACKIVCGKVTDTFFQEHWYAGIRGSIAHIIDMALALWVASRLGKKKRNIWYSKYLSADTYLSENEAIPHFEDWKITHTPGHTDRDISVYNEQEQLIYVADLIVKVKKQLVPPFPVYLPEAYKHSLNKVRKFEGFRFLMAHVAPIKLVKKDLDELINRAPNVPKTNLNAVKNKIRRIYQLPKT